MKTYRVANYQSKQCSTFGTRTFLGFRQKDINTPKTSTSKGTFEETANQWQKMSQIIGRAVAVRNRGKMVERSKALGLGPSIFGFVGSKPTLVNYISLNNFGKVFTKHSILYKKSLKVILVETVLCSSREGRNFLAFCYKRVCWTSNICPPGRDPGPKTVSS